MWFSPLRRLNRRSLPWGNEHQQYQCGPNALGGHFAWNQCFASIAYTLDRMIRRRLALALGRQKARAARSRAILRGEPVTGERSRAGAGDEGVLGLSQFWQDRLFSLGQLFMCATSLFYTASFSSSQWVCRTYNQTHDSHRNALYLYTHPYLEVRVSPMSLQNYGIWKACDRTGSCDRVWNKVEGISVSTVILIQTLATMTFIGYGGCVLMELASHVRILGSLLALNRVTEMVLSCSAVLHFLSMLLFTGEVKNRAARFTDSADAACWGFTMMGVSGVLAVLAVLIMSLFRRLPKWRRPRRHWKLPQGMTTTYTVE